MARMTEHDVIGWFNAAPMGSRQQRMLWAAHKIARLTGATKGSVYQMLERRLERAGPLPPGPQFNGSAGPRSAALALWRSRARGRARRVRPRHAAGRGPSPVARAERRSHGLLQPDSVPRFLALNRGPRFVFGLPRPARPLRRRYAQRGNAPKMKDPFEKRPRKDERGPFGCA